MTSIKKSYLPPSLVSNLQEVLVSRKGGGDGEEPSKLEESEVPALSIDGTGSMEENSKPVVLVTNGDGIEAPGLTVLVEALVREREFNVHVCAPESWVLILSIVFYGFVDFGFFWVILCLFQIFGCRDKSVSGHSVTLQERVSVTSAEINGATAYVVAGMIICLWISFVCLYCEFWWNGCNFYP